MEKWIEKRLPRLMDALADGRYCPAMDPDSRRAQRAAPLPGQRNVIAVLETLIAVLYPGCHGHEPPPGRTIAEHVRDQLAGVSVTLSDQCRRAFAYQCEFDRCRDCGDCRKKAREAVGALLESVPDIAAMLREDILAAYEGDPAARSTMEVVMSYPGIYAISVYRLAHRLHVLGVPLIPRVMGEHAHSRTGIDIHPGADIGPGFFIDHGTGVVIGETCRIGRRVKLYQGVTLGAISFAKDAQGLPIKGIKRHPNVEDHVVIYAGATILGGDTTIGHNSVIGGNVWLTHSIPPFSTVYNLQPKPLIRRHNGSGKKAP